jgi:hypothetical protein
MAHALNIINDATSPHPIVNMNGATVESLIEQIHEAYKKIEEAHKAIQNAFPHGRDYQLNPAGDYAMTRAVWETYNSALVAIHADLTDRLENLCEQRDQRDRQRAR